MHMEGPGERGTWRRWGDLAGVLEHLQPASSMHSSWLAASSAASAPRWPRWPRCLVPPPMPPKSPPLPKPWGGLHIEPLLYFELFGLHPMLGDASLELEAKPSPAQPVPAHQKCTNASSPFPGRPFRVWSGPNTLHEWMRQSGLIAEMDGAGWLVLLPTTHSHEDVAQSMAHPITIVILFHRLVAS